MLSRTITAVVFVGAFAGVASADPILISSVQDIHGSALVEVGPFVSGDQIAEVRSERGGRFDADGTARAERNGASATTSASQHTTIDAARLALFGSGTAAAATSGRADLAVAESISVFSAQFFIREPTSFHFTGTFGATGPDTHVDTTLSGGNRIHPIFSEFIGIAQSDAAAQRPPASGQLRPLRVRAIDVRPRWSEYVGARHVRFCF